MTDTAAFDFWLHNSPPRERYVYWEGSVAREHPFGFEGQIIHDVREAFDAGFIDLVQRRNTGGSYTYYAIKRDRREVPRPTLRFNRRTGA